LERFDPHAFDVVRGAGDVVVAKASAGLTAFKYGQLELGRRLRLIRASGTPRAYADLAALARKHDAIAQAGWDESLEVPKKGAAVPRYAATEARPWLKRYRGIAIEGWGCKRAPTYLGGVPLAEIPGLEKSPARAHHFFLSSCTKCEEEMSSYLWQEKD